jgi:hypothetical protein
METMMSRAANFGCGAKANGRPNVVCLCQSKPFKTEAKREVAKVCSDGKDIGAAREWAISRCTAGKHYATPTSKWSNRFTDYFYCKQPSKPLPKTTRV